MFFSLFQALVSSDTLTFVILPGYTVGLNYDFPIRGSSAVNIYVRIYENGVKGVLYKKKTSFFAKQLTLSNSFDTTLKDFAF